MDAADVNPTLLIGTWKNNSDVNDFKQYTQTAAADGNKEGFAWYAGETIKGQDGTQFYYKVEGNKIYEQEDFMAGTFPRVYTLMSLTKSQLQYFDQFDEIFTFTKQ